ncbi:alpha/beta hydrolase fold protein [Mycobacteroides stephanolepidis]|jgi:pimeloyl-ACP methyl ester carboxylesterase|uniref:Alpha/beta hydrolase fold protein n=1 Tax=[Mycobacterium] stephanolepidis TaxID=1520670 RepID=A0A1Z4F0M5_9MYCO|nr:alpha/beta hydrolase [[Mycobacterium] stephanolepidis]BAX98783.1 alpha/beta hydrolase fold protein [[Mycobacterium] stephanolepidis]
MNESLITRRYATYSGYGTHELAVNGGGPTVLLLHGFGHTAECWRPVLERCARHGVRAVAVDLPGFGSASRLRGGPKLDQLLEFTRELIRTYSATGPVVLAGNSLGGLLSILVAAESNTAQEVAYLVAVDPAGVGWTYPLRVMSIGADLPMKALALAWPAVPLLPQSVISWSAAYLCYGRKDRVDPAMVAMLTEHFDSRGRAKRLAKLAIQVKAEVDKVRLPERITMPITMIHGGRDRLVSVSGARRFCRRILGGRLVVLPHAGHCPHLDEPDRVAEVVIECAQRKPTLNALA